MKILITAPVHISKAYSIQRWIDAIKALNHADVELFAVDNSPNGEIAKQYGDQLPIVVLPNPSEHPYERINASMEVIRQHFLAGDCARWCNIECDIIVPPNIVDVLLDYGEEADWCGHGYPVRGSNREEATGIGCALLSRRLAAAFSFAQANQDSPDVFLWELVKNDGGFVTIEIWRAAPVRHLAEGQ